METENYLGITETSCYSSTESWWLRCWGGRHTGAEAASPSGSL